jgi:hypothetical protein
MRFCIPNSKTDHIHRSTHEGALWWVGNLHVSSSRCETQWLNLLTFWLRDAPTSLTFNNCAFCPHCVCVYCKQRLVPLTA